MRIIFVLALLCPCLCFSQAKNITGRIANELNIPIPGASVTVLPSGQITIADNAGAFALQDIMPGDSLLITAIGYESVQLHAGINTFISVTLNRNTSLLNEVIINTGYQQVPKERTTGSFNTLSNEILNRSASSGILERMENLSPGLLFNKGEAANSDPFLVRGRSTIYANAEPMIVVDNFPYDGDIGSINPFDVESITILKDAAAAAIWGARAGNGVIVITTKKGRTSKPRVQISSMIGIRERPDLYNPQRISSADRIEFEKWLFGKGHYNNINNSSTAPITPVIELLLEKEAGTISPSVADAQVEAMKQYDIYQELYEHLYQPAVYRQHALSISGNSGFHNYYFSAGWDNNTGNLKGSQNDRLTLRANNQFKITPGLQFTASIQYNQTIHLSGANRGVDYTGVWNDNWFPYARLMDEQGTLLPVDMHYRQKWLDTVGNNKLLDWSYNPLADLNEQEDRTSQKDLILHAALKYQWLKYFSAEINYQYLNTTSENSNLYKENSFYARNMVNNYTQFNYTAGTASYPIPRGAIMEMMNGSATSHQGRTQLGFNKHWSNHDLSVMAGYEIRSLNKTTSNNRLYGYNPHLGTIVNNIDFNSMYKLLSSTSSRTIENFNEVSTHQDRFLSAFANAGYTLKNRYIFTASLRKDEANLLGVKANQKGAPFWSAGVSWIISNEDFYKDQWLPYLRLRSSYGYNGNISRLASAYTTIRYGTAFTTPATSASIVTPPNENLRWERIGMLNLGLDFETKNKRFSGSLEVYKKTARDLMGSAPVDPTLGLSENRFFGNLASMNGKGVEVEINSVNIDAQLYWVTTILYSYSHGEISKYLLPVSAAGNAYLFDGNISPVIGRPVFSMYSFPWVGLDPQTGDPIGLVGKDESTNYTAIYNNTPLNEMNFNGPVQPVHFGAIRNTFNYKDFGFSFNISYKLGHVFRTNSLSSTALTNSFTGHSDYSKRWITSGDENSTHIPSLVYPANSTRDQFYKYADVLVKTASHFRLEDIVLDYVMEKKHAKWPFQNLRIFLNLSNLDYTWLFNSFEIDPHYNNTVKDGKKITAGFTASF